MDGVEVKIKGVTVQGTFKPDRWYSALAAIMSVKNSMDISVTVKQPAPDEQASERASA